MLRDLLRKSSFIFALVAIFFVVSTPIPTAYGAEFEFTEQFNSPGTCDQNLEQLGKAGYIEELRLFYDDVTQQLRMEADFVECNGVLPDAYWIVLNDGPHPTGKYGTLAIFYVDGTDPGNPQVTVYGYNGANDFDSYYDGVRDGGAGGMPGIQVPDRLLTSVGTDSSGWLNEVSFTDTSPGLNRTIVLDMDITTIKSHTPVHPNAMPWYGTGMNSELGIWFHPLANTVTEYCEAGDDDRVTGDPNCNQVAAGQTSVGFLKSFNPGIGGWYDANSLTTNDIPYCVYTLNDIEVGFDPDRCEDIELGETLEVVITGVDNDADTLTVTYSGEPANAVITPTNGASIPAPAEVVFTWTPDISNAGQEYFVPITFTDEENGSKVCPLRLCAEENLPPNCEISLLNDDELLCEGSVTPIHVSSIGSSDPEGGELSLSWTSTCLDINGFPENIVPNGADGTATVELTRPGTGLDSNCSIELTVSDPFGQSASCSLDISVPGCELLDCLNKPNGATKFDDCGVCGGNGTSCLDCAGTPFGLQKIDECGVCGGSGACIDCAGQPFGTAVTDRCGVCDGDGQSCLECESTNIIPIQFALDGGVKSQEGLIIRVLNQLAQIGKRRDVAYIQETLAEAHAAQVEAWTNSWQFQNVIVQCTEASGCATVSNTSIADSYIRNSTRLDELLQEAVKRLRNRRIRRHRKSGKTHKIKKSRKLARKMLRRGKEEFETNMENIALIPSEFSDCS